MLPNLDELEQRMRPLLDILSKFDHSAGPGSGAPGTECNNGRNGFGREQLASIFLHPHQLAQLLAMGNDTFWRIAMGCYVIIKQDVSTFII